MNKIHKIQDLVKEMNSSEIQSFPSILKRLDLDSSELSAYESWDKQGYSRNCMEKNDRYELLLLCWNPGDRTPIHNHGGQRCWVYQISGEIEEIRFDTSDSEPKEIYRQTLKPNQLTYIDDAMACHVLANPGDVRSVSIHVYAAPIENCEIYNSEKKCFEQKELSYHNFD